MKSNGAIEIRQEVACSTSEALCMDCIDGLHLMADKSVACVVTSPPYNIGVRYSTHLNSRPDYLKWMKSVFVAIKRVLADDGHFFLQVGGTATKPLIPWDVRSMALAAGFGLQNEIIWVKSITVGDESLGHFKPINSHRYLNQTHEFVFHLTKTGNVRVDRLAVGVPYKDKSNITRFRRDKDLRCGGSVWFIPYETANKIKDRPNHPAMFPVALAERCIKLSGAPKGSLVVDPFVGSGTTLVACDRLGMNGLGFDIDKSYVDYANRGRPKRVNTELAAMIIERRLKVIQPGLQTVNIQESFRRLFLSNYYSSASYLGLHLVPQE